MSVAATTVAVLSPPSSRASSPKKDPGSNSKLESVPRCGCRTLNYDKELQSRRSLFDQNASLDQLDHGHQ